MNRIWKGAAALALAASVVAAAPAVAKKHDPVPHLLVFTGTYGFRHDGIQEAAAELQRQSAETGLFTVEVTGAPEALSRATYGRVDGIVLVNTTGLGGDASPLTAEQRRDFVSFVDCGAALVAVHAAADSGGGWPEYDELLGSHGFDSHPHFSFESRENPAGRQALNPAMVSDVTIQIDDPDHVTTRPWQGFDSFRITDEIYRYEQNPRDDVRNHVVLSLDEQSHYWRSEIGAGPSAGGLAPSVPNPVPNPVNAAPPTAMPDDNPVAWVKTHGAGRVFYTNLGHNMATWERSDFRAHLLAGIRWATEVAPANDCFRR